MTREEAIQDLKDILEEATSDEDAVCYVTSEDADALDMAIEALQAEPTNGRLIDADALIKKLCETTIFIKNGEVFQRMINDAPTVQADRPHGEWVDEYGNKIPLHEDGYPMDSCYCNQCHEWLVASDEYGVMGKFCPNCGADMRKEKE